MIVFGVMLVVASTIGVRLLRARRESLPRIAETSCAEGLAAFEAGRFDLAKQQLATAAEALEELSDPDAATIRQAAREAAILADLANASLEEIVEDVATRDQGLEHFERIHKGRSVLIDAHIAGFIGPERAVDLDYRILTTSRRGRLDLTGLDLFEGKKVGEAVAFGARLKAISLGADGQWVISLEPGSGVLWSSPQGWKALELLGWPAREDAAPPQPRSRPEAKS